jgi:hypothetical protein
VRIASRHARRVFVLALGLLWALTAGPVSAAGGEELFEALAPWELDGELRRFGAAELWQHINGAAELFIAYGFEELIEGDIAAGELRLCLGVYDMGSALNAFGVYRAESSGEIAEAGFGAESQASPPYQWLLLKDRYYVKVEYLEGEASAEQGTALLETIADALPGDDALPPELAWLPEKGRVAGSETYSSGKLFGLAELGPCLHARYAMGEEERRVFLLLPGPDLGVDALWKGLAESWQRLRLDRRAALLRSVPYEGFIGVVETDCGLLGAAGGEDEKAIKRLLNKLKPGKGCASRD